MLQGAMLGNNDADLMRDDLRKKGLLPTEEPYSNMENFYHVGAGGGEFSGKSKALINKIYQFDNDTLVVQSFFENFEVYFTAKDGEHCLKRLEKKSDVDLILMDIEMPKMNGIEATRAIRTQDQETIINFQLL